MAILLHVTQGKRIRPAARCLVGRAPHCHLVLDNSGVSREHAVLFFDGTWKVRDLLVEERDVGRR
ncbi:MAG: FHA domain-containing protein [Polyangiaceae bacterium]